MLGTRRFAALGAWVGLLVLMACSGGGKSGENPSTYSISGTVGGAIASGVTIALSGGSSATTTTDESGRYTFSGLSNGSYTVTPSKTGFVFSPVSLSLTVTGADVTGQDFIATAISLAIYGTVTGAIQSGVTIALSGATSDATTTDEMGNYMFTGLTPGSYTVTPSKPGYTFSPESLSPVLTDANSTAQDFAATWVGFSISGNVSGASSVTVSLGGTSSATTTTDGSGNYTFTGLSNGTYTVTPSKPGYTFSPSTQSPTVNDASATGQSFSATWTGLSISGNVSGASSVTVSLSGTSSATTTTDASGNYTFSGLSNGSYTVTPSKAGYTFSPSSRSPTVSGNDITGQSFSATWAGFSISGNVSGASSVTVSLSGTSSATTTTDGSGNYSFTGLSNGSYTVTASKEGYAFSPPSRSMTVSGTSITGQNFTATVTSYSISGSVSGATLADVWIVLSGTSAKQTRTDANGNYTLADLTNGSYTVTPSKQGFTFSPVSRSVTVNGASVTAQSFVAAAIPGSISGTVSGANVSSGGMAVTITLSGPSSATTITNAIGSYALTGLSPGSYTLTPSTGDGEYTFLPRDRGVTLSDAATGQDFTCIDAEWASWVVPSVSPPSSNYTVNASAGTVTDNVTGLVWQLVVDPGSYTWADAKSYCESLDLGGWSAGWRLPTLVELQSIVDYGLENPAINATVFPATPAVPFWSSSSFYGSGWLVGFYDGSSWYFDSAASSRVRCVR